MTIVEKCDNLDSIADIELIYENAFDEITKELVKHNLEPNNIQKEVQAAMSNQVIKFKIYLAFNTRFSIVLFS